ncbi:3',5'-cyclic-nucleotide phosphodiesterase [Knufia obscura]|uniref:Phosphodiesterase n=2 Tax=Knufia TaxID=430999 RepID=A0AAN8EN98_9EURO|nr:3',5'-cyclic-nucleotide phosphodiesterase [Knufia obscura]KAK5950566.1 3',5'-cyclic-nucleotide phosphodiesterase [Knufia fluminis]
MDPSACRVIYIDERFNTERWISRDGIGPATDRLRRSSTSDFELLPPDLQVNVNAFLSVFNQVYVCRSGRSFSIKLAEIHDKVKPDCTPILACFDVGSQKKHDFLARSRPRIALDSESPLPSPTLLKRELTFSSETDESYGLQLLSRIASDLQVEEGVKLIIPVAVVQPQRKDSYDHAIQEHCSQVEVAREPYGSETQPAKLADTSDIIDPQLMLQCLNAGALDVVKAPLDKAGIMGLTVHAYRIYKSAKAEQSHYMSKARGRKQSWVGMDDEKPYAYLREAMVRKLLKGICDPQDFIEDYQHRDLFVEQHRKALIAEEVGKWSFSGQDFSDDELVYAGYYMLNHALTMPEVEKWRLSEGELLRFMQGCRIAYNSFVLYHNFKHAVDVLQSTFYFLTQIGLLPPYPEGSKPAKYANDKSSIAKLLGPFEALTLLISAIGHDVGHPGVNNMFLVKLNAPLAQLYNDTSVLEAFHCAAYSQILRRHWPTVFHDKAIRKLMISSILATDMGCHSDYMQQLGNLQEKIHESKTTDGWAPKDVEAFRVLTCGLLIKCADISNVARPWAVAEKWTYKLQEEFAHQGEMERGIGMETTLFGGPPEIGNMLKLANGQIGFMTIFAHPLFANLADVIPAMSFAADEILVNKGVWFTKAEHEKQRKMLKTRGGIGDGGISPRSQSPADTNRKSYFPTSPLRDKIDADKELDKANGARKSSSLRQAEAFTTPEQQPDSIPVSANHVTEAGTSSTDQTGTGENNQRSNGITERSDSQSATPRQQPVDSGSTSHDSVTDVELNDKRKDNEVSMRAGVSALPAEDSHRPRTDNSADSTDDALAKFRFATSDVEQPVRTYDPQQHYPAVHPSARASAPMNDMDHQAMLATMAVAEDKGRAVESESAIPDRKPDHIDGGDITPTASTVAASDTTGDRSEEALSSPQTRESQSTTRDRAISASGQHMAPFDPAYSLKSQDSASQEGSKQDFRTTIFSNGDSASDERSNFEDKGNRKLSTKTLGRKRSKLKMSLAFWKKRGSDRSLPEEARRDISSARSTQS